MTCYHNNKQHINYSSRDRQIHRWIVIDRHINRHINRWIDRCLDRQIDRCISLNESINTGSAGRDVNLTLSCVTYLCVCVWRCVCVYVGKLYHELPDRPFESMTLV